MTQTLEACSLAAVWHPCTQMKRHEAAPPIAIERASGPWLYGSDGQRTRSWGADGSRVYLPGYEHRTDTGETKV